MTRDGAGWTADVVNLAGAHTWAPTKAELPAYVDEVIRLVADLPDDAEFAVRGLPDGDEDLERYRITPGTVFEEVDLDERRCTCRMAAG